ncbi:DUF2756 domain-containing protein, partial [Mycobacterium tuberculosis]|nr:DUF2756 domain-containing protein [Mycobacterium tuberculosis]
MITPKKSLLWQIRGTLKRSHAREEKTMKAILFLAALMPLGVLAQPININNNPN